MNSVYSINSAVCIQWTVYINTVLDLVKVLHLSCGLAVSPPTECQMEAWGLKQLSGPGFRPRCDPSGLYWPQQCFQGDCWCVNPATGEQIPGSMYINDPARCGVDSARAFATGKAISKSLWWADICVLCLSKIVSTKQNASALQIHHFLNVISLLFPCLQGWWVRCWLSQRPATDTEVSASQLFNCQLCINYCVIFKCSCFSV